MKKIMLIAIISLIAFSCEKDYYLIPANEVPRWLKDRISHDEKIIQSDPQSGLDVAAWIRYKYEGHYFFEYRNGLSSSGPKVYDYSGDQIMLNQEPYLDFETEKCCKQFVWKGPNYINY